MTEAHGWASHSGPVPGESSAMAPINSFSYYLYRSYRIICNSVLNLPLNFICKSEQTNNMNMLIRPTTKKIPCRNGLNESLILWIWRKKMLNKFSIFLYTFLGAIYLKNKNRTKQNNQTPIDYDEQPSPTEKPLLTFNKTSRTNTYSILLQCLPPNDQLAKYLLYLCYR